MNSVLREAFGGGVVIYAAGLGSYLNHPSGWGIAFMMTGIVISSIVYIIYPVKENRERGNH